MLPWLTRFRRRALGRDPAAGLRPRKARQLFAPLLFLVAGVLVSAALWSALAGKLPQNGFGPVALLPDPAQDDGAGDALMPSAEADLYLPIPSVLDDERVVAALGPIAKLSCHKDDPVTPDIAAPVNASASSDALSAPLAAAGADADTIAGQRLLAAAAAPIAMVAVAPTTPASDATVAGACPALLQQTFNRLQTGKPESLCQFEGKVLVVVNTASYCGYTHQYEGLEAMYRKYKDRGLVVVGFPSNDFGKQEPGTNKEIAEFCRLTYGVQFPMFEKTSVTDLRSNPLFAELAKRTGKTPQWNFHKYIIDRTGNPVASFTSQVEPGDRALVSLIEKLLAEQPRKS